MRRRIRFSRHSATEPLIRQARAAGPAGNLFRSDDPRNATTWVGQGIEMILTNCAHTMIAGGFRPMEREGG